MSAMTSRMSVRTIRFLSRASAAGRLPDGSQIPGQGHQRCWRQFWPCRRGIVVRGDLDLNLTNVRERQVPARLQFRRYEPVCRIGGVILPESPVSGVTYSFQIAQESFADLIALGGACLFSRDRRCDGTRFDGLQKFDLDRIVRPATRRKRCSAARHCRVAPDGMRSVGCGAWLPV